MPVSPQTSNLLGKYKRAATAAFLLVLLVAVLPFFFSGGVSDVRPLQVAPAVGSVVGSSDASYDVAIASNVPIAVGGSSFGVAGDNGTRTNQTGYIQTTVSLNIHPVRVALGSQVLVKVSVSPSPPAASDVFGNLTIIVLCPDGTVDLLGPFQTATDGLLSAKYLPSMIGDYKIHASYDGLFFASHNVTYLGAESPEAALTVLSELSQRTWIVDDDGSADFHTIQEAINAANVGDVISVKNGRYREGVVVNKTQLTIYGESEANTIVDATGDTGILVTADKTTISGFRIERAGSAPYSGNGIELSSSNNILTNNIITLNNNYGVFLNSSHDNVIQNNHIVNNYWCGIVLLSSDYNRISSNYIAENLHKNNGVGVLLLDDSDFNILESNTLFKNDGGIGLASFYSIGNCDSNTIRNNNITENSHDGIFLYDDGQYNRIEFNNIARNGGGIHLSYSPTRNTIVGNDILENSYGGIGFEGAPLNTFYHNNLIGNKPQVHYTSTDTSWDDGYPSGGNYWSDYTGVDNNHDGIGDTAYVIDGQNKDRYPLMQPWKQTAKTWIVDDDGPADFSSIQAAIDASKNGDIISVRSGHYYEHIEVAKSITLLGENPHETIIDGFGTGNVVTVNASNVVVSGFTIERSEARWLMAGIWLSSASRGCKVTNNFLVNCACGVYLTSCSGNFIMQNGMAENEYSITLDSSTGNVISGNNIENSTVIGITVSFSSHNNTITENTVANNGSTGICVLSSSNQVVSLNEITGFQFGIELKNSSNNYVSNNIITNSSQCGIGLEPSYNSTVSANNLEGNGGGIYLLSSSGNLVSENYLSSRWFGIQLTSSSNNTILENAMIGGLYGVHFMWSSDNNDMFGNSISETSSWVFWIDLSSNNRIYHNSLNITKGMYTVDSTNIWDNGYPSGGNYWSSYRGVDYNADGIGDTPYVIAANNVDRYPLVSPHYIHEQYG